MSKREYPTTKSEIDALHERSRSGDRKARWTVALHRARVPLPRGMTVGFLSWAVESWDAKNVNAFDPLQSDFALSVAWRAWSARAARAESDRKDWEYIRSLEAEGRKP